MTDGEIRPTMIDAVRVTEETRRRACELLGLPEGHYVDIVPTFSNEVRVFWAEGGFARFEREQLGMAPWHPPPSSIEPWTLDGQQVQAGETIRFEWGSSHDWPCRVYWGSHGCMYERGHGGPHECACSFDEHGAREPKYDEDGVHNVGAPPYYGRRHTWFYGEDAPWLHKVWGVWRLKVRPRLRARWWVTKLADWLRWRERGRPRWLVRARRWFWQHTLRYPWEMCDRCGRPASRGMGDSYWFAPNRLWNEVNGSANGVACGECFERECSERGISISWRAQRIEHENDAVPPEER